MKELLANLEMVRPEDAINHILIDTCEFVHIFEHPKKISDFERKLADANYAITSFNVDELMHIEHRLSPKVKEGIRRFLKEKEKLKVIDVGVHPGNRDAEISYIRKISPELASVIKDPSDGIMFATAIRIKGDIITRDKHDLYNQHCERFANEHDIDIRNKI
jgi:hypothetical protein